MKVLSTQEMKQAEQYAITSCGIASLVLMEYAGKAVAREIYEYLKKIKLCNVDESREKYFADCKRLSIIKYNRLSQNIVSKHFYVEDLEDPRRAEVPVGRGSCGTEDPCGVEDPRRVEDPCGVEDLGDPAAFGRAASGRAGRGEYEVLVFAGTGNNGGDGFVAARHLAACGIKALVIIAGDPSRFSPDAKINFKKLEDLRVNWQTWQDIDLELLSLNTGLVVDAIFGTGISREVSSPFVEMISWINKSTLPVVAVDIPSGVCSDTGKVLGLAVRSYITVTMGALKKGLLLYPGRDFAGDIVIADIGLPENIAVIDKASAETLIINEARKLLPKREPDAHKGDCGRLLVIGGSTGMVGAPALTCLGALRTGAGLVTAAMPETITNAFHPMLSEAMSVPIPLTSNGTLNILSQTLLSQIDRFQAIVLGPGIKLDLTLLKQFLQDISIPIVLDAGALNILSYEDLKGFSSYKSDIIITPHEGELGKIIGKDSSEIRANRFDLVKELSMNWHVTIVLKGAATLVAKNGFPVFINSSGNSAMATAGSGDVLSGVIGALLSQGIPSREAACLGVLMHGLSGDNAAANIGETGILASEIANSLPFVFQKARYAVELKEQVCYNHPGMHFEKNWCV